jgi:hypothetical protein
MQEFAPVSFQGGNGNCVNQNINISQNFFMSPHYLLLHGAGPDPAATQISPLLRPQGGLQGTTAAPAWFPTFAGTP